MRDHAGRLTVDDVARAAGVSKGAVSTLLTAGDEAASGPAQPASTGSPDAEAVLPDPGDAVSELLRLAVPHEDIDAIVRCLPVLQESRPLRWLLERCVHVLVRCMDHPEAVPRLPTVPNRHEPERRYFYVFVFLAMLPHLRSCTGNETFPSRCPG